MANKAYTEQEIDWIRMERERWERCEGGGDRRIFCGMMRGALRKGQGKFVLYAFSSEGLSECIEIEG